VVSQFKKCLNIFSVWGGAHHVVEEDDVEFALLLVLAFALDAGQQALPHHEPLIVHKIIARLLHTFNRACAA
jgi:hypothetical protein